MTTAQLLFLILVFLVMSGGAFLAMLFFTANPVRRRLEELFADSPTSATSQTGQWVEKVVSAAGPIARLNPPEISSLFTLRYLPNKHNLNHILRERLQAVSKS